MKWLKRFRTWMRVVLPFEGVVLVWVGLQSFVWLGSLAQMQWGEQQSIAATERLSFTISMVMAIAYGVYRVWYFHPVENRFYGEWLLKTPWTVGEPLPLGPLHFAWQDAVILLVLGIASSDPIPNSISVAAGFVAGYCGMQAFFAMNRCEPIGAYSSIFFFGLGVIIWFQLPVLLPLIAIGMCAVAHMSNRILLDRFARGEFLQDAHRKDTTFNLGFISRDALDGWPTNLLSRPVNNTGVPQLHALLVGLSISWLLYSLLCHFPVDLNELNPNQKSDPEAALIGLFVLLLYAIIPRLWIYCRNHRPPLSVLGRIATGRFIIPGYDKVFAFILVIGLGLTAVLQLPEIGFRWKTVVPIAVGFVIWAVLGVGPKLKNWSLTGHHRIVPGMRNRQRFETL